MTTDEMVKLKLIQLTFCFTFRIVTVMSSVASSADRL